MNSQDRKLINCPLEVSPDDSIVVSRILVNHGDSVEEGENVIEIETSKATYVITAPSNGFVEFYFSEGERVSSIEALGAILQNKNELTGAISEKRESVKQPLFTDKALEKLKNSQIKITDVAIFFEHLSIVTSEDVSQLIEKKKKEKTIPAEAVQVSVFSDLILGNGHRGKAIEDLILHHSQEARIAFVDYSLANKDGVSQNPHHNVFTLEEFQGFISQFSGDVYWCLPHKFDRNYTEQLWEKVEKKLVVFLSSNSVISNSASLGAGTLVFPHVVIGAHVKIGRAVAIESGVVIGTNVKIGDFSILSNGSSIAHDSTLGDFSSLSDGCRIAGRVSIGSNTLIGLNATVNMDVSVGDHVIVNSGANVYKNVPAYSIVTNDGRILPRRK